MAPQELLSPVGCTLGWESTCTPLITSRPLGIKEWKIPGAVKSRKRVWVCNTVALSQEWQFESPRAARGLKLRLSPPGQAFQSSGSGMLFWQSAWSQADEKCRMVCWRFGGLSVVHWSKSGGNSSLSTATIAPLPSLWGGFSVENNVISNLEMV